MGTHVRPPSRIAAVSVGVLWGDRRRETRPELLPVTEVGVAIVDFDDGEAVVEQRERLEQEDIKLAAEHLLDLALPIVTYNGLNFDLVALDTVAPGVDALIPHVVDVATALLPAVADIVDAEKSSAQGTSAFPRSGDYGVLNVNRVAETNLGHLPGESNSAIGDAELVAALWHHFVSYERAVLAGRTHPLESGSIEHLCGRRPAFESAEDWHATLAERPEPRPYRRRDRHQITFPRVDQRYV